MSIKPTNKTFQRLMICGRLANDPVFRVLDSGKTVCNFGLIVNLEYGDSDYIPCVAWEQKAKLIKENTEKGSLVLCEGKIKSSNFEDSEKRKQFKLQFEISPKGETVFFEGMIERKEGSNG